MYKKHSKVTSTTPKKSELKPMKNSPESREIPCNQTQNTAWVPGIRV
jgi:hypothetical protein